MAAPLFSFQAEAFAGTSPLVVRFRGAEGLSTPYSFIVTLMLSGDPPDFDACINAPVSLVVHDPGGDFPIHGIVTRFEVLQQAKGKVFCRLRLHPRLWLLSRNVGCKIFLEKTVPECIEETLRHQQFASGTDFEFKLQESYPRRELIMQYNESLLDFISRWMEREGIYYYFEQGQDREKLVITDTKIAHTAMPGAHPLHYTTPSNLQQSAAGRIVSHLSVAHNLVPQSVLFKDYNYRTPRLDLQQRIQVSKQGQGEVYTYAENPKTPDEARRLATVRAEALACRGVVAQGESGSPTVRAGWLFELKDHYDGDWNREWCVTRVRHAGSQEGYIFSQGGEGEGEDEKLFYRAAFEAIPSDVQYRSAPQTAWPRIHGALNARIDAAGSGEYAELDEHGRYKVLFPQDLSGRKEGHGSNWLRMAQPYGGSGHGMHFPLHKGTEALLSFLDGDPDRPCITGAAPNPETPSPVTNGNQTQCRVTTAGQNKMHIEDRAGDQRILMSTPTANSYARMGSHNDPPPIVSPSDDMLGWKFNTGKLFDVQAGTKNTVVIGNYFKNILGWEHRETFGLRTNTVLGGNLGIFLAYRKEFTPFKSSIHALAVRMGLEKTKLVEEQVNLAEEHFDAAQEKTTLAMNKTKVMQNSVSLSENKTRLAGQKTELAQQKAELAQEKTVLAQQKTQLVQTRTQLVQNQTNLVQDRVDITESWLELSEARTQIVESKTQLAAEKMEVAESVSKLASDTFSLAAEQNDM